MSSFINLMGNDVWSAVDIKSRLHAEIRGEVSENSETELNRALQGAALGLYTLSATEKAGVLYFKSVMDKVEALGLQARADMALLNAAMSVETAQRRLAQELVLLVEEGEPPEPINSEAVATDAQEREIAQAVVDTASAEVLALTLLRNPPPPPVPESGPLTPTPVEPAAETAPAPVAEAA